MKFTLPIFFAAALAASSSAEAASFSFTKAEFSEVKLISNSFLYFYEYEAAGVITHNNKSYDTTVALECELETSGEELLCEGELDVDGYTADVELVYSVSKNLVYWATTTSSSAMETAAELWTDQVVQDVIYSSDGTIKDGNWIGLPYAWAHGRTIYWWVHESVLGQIILPPEL